MHTTPQVEMYAGLAKVRWIDNSYPQAYFGFAILPLTFVTPLAVLTVYALRINDWDFAGMYCCLPSTTVCPQLLFALNCSPSTTVCLYQLFALNCLPSTVCPQLTSTTGTSQLSLRTL